MIVSLALIYCVSVGQISAWSLLLLLFTWVPDVVLMGLIGGYYITKDTLKEVFK